MQAKINAIIAILAGTEVSISYALGIIMMLSPSGIAAPITLQIYTVSLIGRNLKVRATINGRTTSLAREIR